MTGRLRYAGWICVVYLGFAAQAEAQATTPPAAAGGETPPPPLQPVAPASPTSPAPQPVTPQHSSLQPAAATPAAQPAAAGAVDAEVAAHADTGLSEPTREFDDELRFRAHNTWFGPTGGLRIVDADSGPAGTARLQFGFDYFSASEFLYVMDHNEWLGGVLSLDVTPIEHLEAFASLSTHSNSNTAGDPVLLQVSGDVTLGVKGFAQVLPWLGVGGDLRFLFLNTIGDLGVIANGTSIGFRGAATADMRRIREPLPLIFRANVEYLLDNSGKIVEGVEQARYDALGPDKKPYEDEDRHLVTRIERFALGINRVDMLTFGLGVEAPFKVMTDFFLQPLVEWRMGVPINRQGYSCLAVTTTGGIDGEDSCLAIEGLSAAPSTLTLGVRVLPPLRGLSALLAFDIGLSGTSTFVRELAPNRPWAFLMTVGYAIDARPPKPQIQYVTTAAPAGRESAKTRVRGVVVERGFTTPIIGAIVRYPDYDLSPQLTNVEGRFVSYGFDPGAVTIEVSHPDYDPGRCGTTIPAPQPGAAGPEFVELRCELTARPRSGAVRGSVRDDKDAPVPGVSVSISGPSPQTAVTDGGGNFALAGLPVGDYTATVDAPKYLLKSQAFSIGNGDTNIQLVLVAKPKEASVTLTSKEVKIRDQIMFKSSSAEIDERSTALLSEIADVLLRNPQVTHVQVQGHTDNVGDPEQNLTLSQQRAEAVVQWLVGAGVTADRLEAKGYGDARPLVPNLTPGNRARNRRVQFIVVKDQAAQ